MIGELFAQRGDLLRRNRSAGVSPFLTNVCQDVGELLIIERFFPRLHDGAAILLTLDLERALQTFKHDHGIAERAAIYVFGASQGRISLCLRTLPIRLMTDRAVRQKNLLAAFDRS